MMRKLNVLREGLEKKGSRVNLSKTKLTVGGDFRHNTKNGNGHMRLPWFKTVKRFVRCCFNQLFK